METDRLQFFCTIAETGSLTKAAEILGISHSGLSKSMTVLQAEIQMPLFRPQGRGLELTVEGQCFYQKARQILQQVEDLKKKTLSPASIIRIGLSEVLAVSCAGLIAKEFTEPLSLIESDIGEIEGQILNGEIDFGLAFVPSPKPELDYLEIITVKFNSYADAGLAKKGLDVPYVVPTSQYPFNPLGYKIRDGWPQDIPRHPRFMVNNFAAAMQLVQAKTAAAYLPDFVVSLLSGNIVRVKEHRLAETQRKIFLVKLKGHQETPAMKKACKALRQLKNHLFTYV